MGKKGDPRVQILPSTTRKGIVLSTSAKFDSPSVISKFASPPPHDDSIESGSTYDSFDDASTVLDETGSLGHFIESLIARLPNILGLKFLLHVILVVDPLITLI